ncbi:MAG: HNH endonuclease [FCB group bacterium]|nr:HNH endonuclease [FCB group bacterium]
MVNSAVLVLNQNYEPLSVCSARRAIIMQLLGKVDVVETYDGLKVHSATRSIPLPSVVRLSWYVNVPYKRILLTRKNIIKRDRHTCQYCGDKKGMMTVDHVIPKRFRGGDTWENLVCACASCNNKKGDRPPEQAGMRLSRLPRRPNHITFIQSFIGISDERWKPYLFLD